MARQERERRYIAEYMADNFPDNNYVLNVELGPIPDEFIQRYGPVRAAALFRPTRLRVDAVAWFPDKYLLIEAKLRNMKDGIGDLLIYKRLAPQTADLPYYDGQPFVAQLVVPWDLPWLREITQASDIEYVEQDYPWVHDYVQERQKYFTAEYRVERAKTMKLRKTLGVE